MPVETNKRVPIPGHLGLYAIIPHPDEKDRFWVIVQGYSLFETTDGGQTWGPRNRGLRRDWPADYEEIGFCDQRRLTARRACPVAAHGSARQAPGSWSSPPSHGADEPWR